jgi:hypothetical protein
VTRKEGGRKEWLEGGKRGQEGGERGGIRVHGSRTTDRGIITLKFWKAGLLRLAPYIRGYFVEKKMKLFF